MGYFNRLRIAAAVAVAIGVASLAAPASAQATRTWVSGVGDDVNPCSRTAPCKTFAGAISKTAAGGEINCLDPGGFGAVTITKSMTISCPYTEGGALAGGNGITVNLPAQTDAVYLRGLDIFGVNPPSNGVRFIGQGTLHIEDTVIRRFNAANSFGISAQPTGAARLVLNNVTIANNGGAASGGGMLVQPTGAGSVQVLVENTRIVDNVNIGFRVIVSAGTGAPGVTGLLDNVTVARTNGGDGIQAVAAAGAPPARLMIVNSNVTANSSRGITADGSSASMRVAHTSITTNGTGVQAVNSAVINTYGNNRNDGNGADGAFTLPIIPEE
jgi:hypothetical protein